MELFKSYWHDMSQTNIDKFHAYPENIHQLEPHYPKAEVPIERLIEDEEDVEQVQLQKHDPNHSKGDRYYQDILMQSRGEAFQHIAIRYFKPAVFK